MEIIGLIFALGCAYFAYNYANENGRNAVLWAAFSFFFPLLGLLLLFLVVQLSNT